MNGFRLDELRIDPLTGEVSGPGGREKLDPKVLDVLVYMAQHAGQVVSREDLLARLWPNTVVSDDALSRCFYELRRQLSLAGGDERYRAILETLPKRGYRLNGSVTPARPRRMITAIVIGVTAAVLVAIFGGLYVAWLRDKVAAPAPTASPDSIAVLPFIDLSEQKDQEYFSYGVAEEVLNRLSQAKNLRVISRTSSFSFQNETLDVPQIGARLNVSYVLEGSIRRSGDRVRITAQLIDVTTNAHVWSETFDRSIGDLFAIQDEIASSVAAALQVTLAGGQAKGATPQSVEAYERFLQGEFFFHRRAPGDIERSVQYYQEAVELDPRYARAWAARAGAYALQELRQKQGEAARKAVELDSRLAVAQARLAQFYYQSGQRDKGDEHFRAAVSLDPDDPLVLGFSTTRAVFRGDIKGAVAIWRRLVAGDPLSAVNRSNLGGALLADGQWDEALSELRQALELSPGAGPDLELHIVRALILLGRYDEAQTAIARLPEGRTRDCGFALLHLVPDRMAGANAALDRLKAPTRDVRGSICLAEVYAFRGMNEQAIAYMKEERVEFERERERKPYLIWNFLEELRLSPFLRLLQADPRWSALVETPA